MIIKPNLEAIENLGTKEQRDTWVVKFREGGWSDVAEKIVSCCDCFDLKEGESHGLTFDEMADLLEGKEVDTDAA